MSASTPNTAPELPVVPVVAAALVEGGGRVLLARRHAGAHQGGLWEFPGGKLEPGEGAEEALARELAEELGIRPLRYRPLIRVRHTYADRTVILDTWRVTAWEGEPRGLEGQPLAWVAPEALDEHPMPAADRPIVSALRLPECCLVTPDPGPPPHGSFLRRLEAVLGSGVAMVILRAPSLEAERLIALAAEATAIAERYGASLLLNGEPEWAEAAGAHGLHLNRHRLRGQVGRPLDDSYRVGASCHDAEELELAAAAGVDYVLCSPVLATPSHPGAPTLGWEGLARLCEEAQMPVYALGGVGPAHLPESWAAGAQGIAAIRALWEGGS